MDDLVKALQQLLVAVGALAATSPAGGSQIQAHLALAQEALDAFYAKNAPPQAKAEAAKEEKSESEDASDSGSSSSRRR